MTTKYDCVVAIVGVRVVEGESGRGEGGEGGRVEGGEGG